MFKPNDLPTCPARPIPSLGRVLVAGALATLLGAPAQADERQSIEQLRATTLGLIDALVQQGLLSRERADALLRQAQAAGQAAAATPGGPQWGSPATGSAAAPAGNVIRVPYVPETLKNQLREELRHEVLAAAREEGWADPKVMPDWVRGLSLGGDLRVRLQAEQFARPRYAAGQTDPCVVIGGNLPAPCWRGQLASPAWAPDLLNTSANRERLTLRARLAVNAKVGADTSAELRLSTDGSGPASTSATLSTAAAKPTVVVDRALLRWEPRYDLRVIAGRMPSPYFGNELGLPDDLVLDGAVLQGERDLAVGTHLFATAGVFALQELETSSRDKWLQGLQVGLNWAPGGSTQLRTALAHYRFANVEGWRETAPAPSGVLAGTTAYASTQYAWRRKGNTLINLNDPTSTAAPTWGLASRFATTHLSSALTLKQLDPWVVGLQFDWLRNGAFDRADIERRAGLALPDLKAMTTAWQTRVQFGHERIADTGDWQVWLALRKFERDAWLDALTDTTWHLGGTNYRGWQLGGHWAMDRRTTLGLRLTSSRNLTDGRATASSHPLAIDVLQLDWATRF